MCHDREQARRRLSQWFDSYSADHRNATNGFTYFVCR